MIDLSKAKGYQLKEQYDSKQGFIKDFIRACRAIKNHEKECELKYFSVITTICGEIWQFNAFSREKHIETSCALVIPNNRWIHYPLTQWDNVKYRRWDTDLRTFLDREICKQ